MEKVNEEEEEEEMEEEEEEEFDFLARKVEILFHIHH
jgi:hypothetical protein